MAKAKTSGATERRFSRRLAAKPKPPQVETKKKAAIKKAPKGKKTKAENGNTKAEEPKAAAAEAK